MRRAVGLRLLELQFYCITLVTGSQEGVLKRETGGVRCKT
jgi:hypothetical protein